MYLGNASFVFDSVNLNRSYSDLKKRHRTARGGGCDQDVPPLAYCERLFRAFVTGQVAAVVAVCDADVVAAVVVFCEVGGMIKP